MAQTFEFLCKEKEGEVRRSVRLMGLSVPKILDTIEKMNKVRNFLPKENPVAPFIRPGNVFFEVDDVGMIALVPENGIIHCHITFWDRRLRGREELCKTVAEWAHALTGKILATGIPETSPAVIAFAKRLGFKEARREQGIVVLCFSNYTE